MMMMMMMMMSVSQVIVSMAASVALAVLFVAGMFCNIIDNSKLLITIVFST